MSPIRNAEEILLIKENQGQEEVDEDSVHLLRDPNLEYRAVSGLVGKERAGQRCLTWKERRMVSSFS